MTDFTPPSSADRRDTLRARIEAAERRNAERTLADQAREAAAAATEYTRARPLTVIGGALALGLLVGLATRPGRKVAARAVGAVGSAASGAAGGAAAGVRNVAARGGSQITALFGDAALAWGMKLLDEVLEGARTGQDRVEDLADETEATARRIKREAGHAVGKASDTARHAVRKTKRKATRAVRDTVGKVKA